MSRQKKQEKEVTKPLENKKLTPGQFWEWRCTTEELKSAKLNERRTHLERELMNKEIEVRKLKLLLFKESLISARQSVEAAEKEYENFKNNLEKDLEVSLNNCIIDEYTYEIKPIEESKEDRIISDESDL